MQICKKSKVLILMSFNLTTVRNDTLLVIYLRNNGRLVVSHGRDNCQCSSKFKAREIQALFSVIFLRNFCDCIWVRIFEFQINEQYVVRVRIDTSRDLARFSPAIIEARRRRLCCRCRMLFMRLYGKGDAASGDAVAALLGMHRSRHGRRMEVVAAG